MKLFLLFTLLSFSAYADLVKRKQNTQKDIDKKSPSSKKIEQQVHLKSSSTRSEVRSIIEDTDKKNANAVSAFINSKNLGISDNTSTFDILSGTVINGIILNSVVSSNLDSPLVVQVNSNINQIPENSKLLCFGITRGKRIAALCNRLIAFDEEYEINATLLNTDGTNGLTGTTFFTGKEELVVGAIVGGGISAALDVSRDRLSTSTGELVTSSYKNKLLSGAMGGVDQAVEIMGEESKNKDTKVVIEAGKPVLIYFNQRFKI